MNEVYIKENFSDWYLIEQNTKLEFKRKIRLAKYKKTNSNYKLFYI